MQHSYFKNIKIRSVESERIFVYYELTIRMHAASRIDETPNLKISKIFKINQGIFSFYIYPYHDIIKVSNV